MGSPAAVRGWAHGPLPVSPLLDDLLQLFGLGVEGNMELACFGVDDRLSALHGMNLSSLETILREIRRYGDRYVRALAGLDDANARASEAVDEYYRMSDMDIAENEQSLRRVMDELLVTHERQRKELCIAFITDSDWWREVSR